MKNIYNETNIIKKLSTDELMLDYTKSRISHISQGGDNI